MTKQPERCAAAGPDATGRALGEDLGAPRGACEEGTESATPRHGDETMVFNGF